MHPVRRTTAATLAAVLATSLIGVGGAAPAAARPSSPAAAGAASPAAVDLGATTVTLITGDRITVTDRGAAVAPAPGRRHLRFHTYQLADGRYVVPTDAQPLIRAGVLDRRLFNVTNLITYGYHDAATDRLPLLVEYAGPATAARRATGALAGTRITRDLPAIGGAAVSADKATAGDLWTAVTGATAGSPTTASRSLAAGSGIARIWLDGKRRLLLEHSVGQIGAPAAHDAGLTGAGVTVAVLDSGVDADHPDLAGRVADAENFTEDPDPADVVGHGTHVASIIAGSGAASEGANRGVAPDATIVSGKVCESYWCTESAMLAGMQWAAADQQATVINFSIGGQDTPEIDPLEEAVDTLTAQTGALFVIAAGNSGTDASIGSPGSADAALTVGAVDRDDTLADFSSRGPRTGDDAVKPDITAPGVGIVAARAAGTTLDTPVDAHYVAASGTSMATPHVTGAVALLAQRRPGWSAQRLKAALMGAAAPQPGTGAYPQGAGRVDVARAITQRVVATPASVSFGRTAWPHHDDEAVTKTVTYRNTTGTDQTLALAVDAVGPTGTPAPAGVFSAGATEVTVPAQGTAEVVVTADTSVDGPDGYYSGHLVATGADGVRVVTPFGVNREVESYDLTLAHLDQTGAPTDAYWTVAIGLDQPYDAMPWRADGSGSVTVRLPAGRYGLSSMIERRIGEGDDAELELAVLVRPNLKVTADTAVTFDGRRGQPVRVTVPEPTARPALVDVGFAYWTRNNAGAGVGLLSDTFDGLTAGQFGAPPRRGEFAATIASQWLRPDGADGFVGSPYFYGLTEHFVDQLPTGFTRHYRPRDLATVRHRFRGVAHGDATDRTVFGSHGERDPGGWALVAPVELPTVRVEHYSVADTLTWNGYLEFSRKVPGQQWGELTAMLTSMPQRYPPGRQIQDTWNVAPYGPVFADTTYPGGWVRRDGDVIAVEVPLFGDADGHPGSALTDSGRTALYRDGKLVGESEYPGYGWFEVPRAEAEYRLEVAATHDVSDFSTSVSGVWTFASGPVTRGQVAALPVMAVRFAPAVDAGNTAPAGRAAQIPFTIAHQPGVAGIGVRKPVVEVSYDGGDSWLPAQVRSAKAGWTASVHHPDADGFVSLRASVTDRDGNTVQQTIIQAYRITVR
ncbi:MULTISPECIES: S8 family serine peptidase [unclassified Solwaraspora]|uniref:S8 family serine peptidase n=1 Tax=unclassified Solwaraspora TaxID=2627926 RepID=UPI00259BEB84|nr:S8 family serine peptidase [Solwaraspora sp. WMMA2056]WJK40527.1 S8 family serine peptidase [Solwaraspora sp. WMMA2056]